MPSRSLRSKSHWCFHSPFSLSFQYWSEGFPFTLKKISWWRARSHVSTGIVTCLPCSRNFLQLRFGWGKNCLRTSWFCSTSWVCTQRVRCVAYLWSHWSPLATSMLSLHSELPIVSGTRTLCIFWGWTYHYSLLSTQVASLFRTAQISSLPLFRCCWAWRQQRRVLVWFDCVLLKAEVAMWLVMRCLAEFRRLAFRATNPLIQCWVAFPVDYWCFLRAESSSISALWYSSAFLSPYFPWLSLLLPARCLESQRFPVFSCPARQR